MNRLAKGRRIELLAKKWYESRGWTVYRPPWNRWGEKDIFGYADLLCAAKGREPMLVQVRVRSRASPSAMNDDRNGMSKTEAARAIASYGLRVVLLLYAGKRAKRVPEWEERTMMPLSKEWVKTYP